MTIVFCLPGYARHPTGGFKIIYEYANRLASHHRVTVVHPDLLLTGSPPREWPVRIAGWALRQVRLTYRPGAWFAFDPRVEVRTVPGLHPRFVPDAEVVVATAWTTAEWVRRYPRSKGRKLYWVQDYEHVMTAPPALRERMLRTYRGRFELVVISPALRDFLDQQGIRSRWIPNAIDAEVFHPEIAITSSERNLIGFPYRSEPYKGTTDVLRALAELVGPLQLAGKVWCFGSKPRPKLLPSWARYHQRPSNDALRQLYNQTRIFVVGSHYEGWGLPGMEAMACGATLVCTDNGGSLAYAQHGTNALLCPPKRPDLLARSVRQLMEDDALRVALAQSGVAVTRQYTWEHSLAAAESLFSSPEESPED